MDSNELCLKTTPKFWETESSELQQITDVQGRLKENIAFWKDLLNAPPQVLDYIRDGYYLPLKFIPQLTPSIITSRPQHTVSS